MRSEYWQYVGRTPDRCRAFVCVTLDEHSARPGVQTVDHQPWTGPYRRLSIWGGTVWRRRDFETAGQCIDDIASVNDFAPGWDKEAVDDLVDLWRRWHLNDMRAACAHMVLPEDRSYDARKDIECPVTGYRYGRAWLLEALPTDVKDRVRALQARPQGDLPAWLED